MNDLGFIGENTFILKMVHIFSKESTFYSLEMSSLRARILFLLCIHPVCQADIKERPAD